jgi:multiple sugar transport system permease protein
MASAARPANPIPTRPARTGRTTSRRQRILLENLTAYAFLSPALILILVFGVLPVVFAFYVSLHQWRRFPGEYRGLDNYVQGLDEFAYVLFFFLAAGLIGYGLYTLWQLVARTQGVRLRGWACTALLPAGGFTLALYTGLAWINVLLPIVLNIPQRIRGQERVPGLFMNELVASFQMPDAYPLGNAFLACLVGAIALAAGWYALAQRALGANGETVPLATWLQRASIGVALLALGALLLDLTVREIDAAVLAAREAGETLPLWTQIVLVTIGVLGVAGAYAVWRWMARREGKASLAFGLFAVGLLAVAGVVFITQLPLLLASADFDVLHGLTITTMFAVGTVPFQIGIGLLLAYMLFQKIKGRTFFRIVYFLPYIMPFAATSVVFGVLFSFRPESPANQVVNVLGIPNQRWLLEANGIGELLFGQDVPVLFEGPSLALIVIMIYTVWTYIGYNAVVFLAGLGTISGELYEAARIDGANEWAIFRRITLPLLSPTTFFLLLIAVIGTFQAFTQIWILRNPASQSSVDTLGVYIFETVRRTDPSLGYGSALSFVLFGVILLLTFVQNRIARRQVFYG